MLRRGVRLERLPLDLLEQVRPPAQELVVRELPRLHVGGGALCARRLWRRERARQYGCANTGYVLADTRRMAPNEQRVEGAVQEALVRSGII